MAKNIYVGNLPYDTTGDDLVALFATYGDVTAGQVIIDKFSGRSRGFGFVVMNDDAEAQAAIDALSGIRSAIARSPSTRPDPATNAAPPAPWAVAKAAAGTKAESATKHF